MLLTIVSATPFEIAPLTQYLQEHFELEDLGIFKKDQLSIRVVVTGVGMPLTALQLGLYLAKERPDLLINAGVAGAINRKLNLGDVVNIIADRFGDLGVEEADGQFTDMHELGLIDADDAPFEKGWLNNPAAQSFDFLPKATGITVNTVHGSLPSIDAFTKKYTVDTESMEGAAVSLACLQTKVNFLALRAISNYVETRDRANWKLDLATENLNATLQQIIESFLEQASSEAK